MADEIFAFDCTRITVERLFSIFNDEWTIGNEEILAITATLVCSSKSAHLCPRFHIYHGFRRFRGRSGRQRGAEANDSSTCCSHGVGFYHHESITYPLSSQLDAVLGRKL